MILLMKSTKYLFFSFHSHVYYKININIGKFYNVGIEMNTKQNNKILTVIPSGGKCIKYLKKN